VQARLERKLSNPKLEYSPLDSSRLNVTLITPAFEKGA
jgi:hypothetical protein